MTTTKDEIIQAIMDVTTRRIGRWSEPGVVRVYRNADDEVCVEVLDEEKVK